jgi:hypothetical protein
MKPNVGEGDRLLRAILGIYSMLLGYLFIQGAIGIIVGVLGTIALLTSLVGWCPAYELLDRSTLEAEPTPEGAEAQAQEEEAHDVG